MQLVTLLALALLLAACGGKDDPSPDADAVDSDSDADTDTDSDADTDTDTDTDADTDVPQVFAFATDDPSAYARVDRMGMPGVATALIRSADDYNAADPAVNQTGLFLPEIGQSIEKLHQGLDDDLVALGLTPCAVKKCADQATPLVVPDVIGIDTGLVAGFPNGRLLADPAMDVTLALVLLDLGVHPVTTFATLPLNPPANDLAFLPAFPYLAPAH